MYLLLQLVLLFAQITSEELEDDLSSKEGRADARLNEHNVAEGSNEEPTPEDAEHNGQRDGKGTNQPDQTVTQLQLPGSDSCCHARHRKWFRKRGCFSAPFTAQLIQRCAIGRLGCWVSAQQAFVVE